MSAKSQILPTGRFAPVSGTGTFTEARKQIGVAIETGLRSLVSGARNAEVSYRIEPHDNGSFHIVVEKVKKPSARAKAPSAPLDIDSALAAARQRGEVRIAEILAGDDMASADAFAALLGITRQSLHARLGKHQVLGLEGAKRGFKFPTWQITSDGKPLAGLPRLFETLEAPWTVYRFLVQFQPQLGTTGLEALQTGRSDEAIALAQNLERSGA